jgi:hypothetical protein
VIFIRTIFPLRIARVVRSCEIGAKLRPFRKRCLQLSSAKKGFYMPAEKIKLLPCPFCGGKAVYVFDDGANWNKGVGCKKCEMNIYFFKNGTNVSKGNQFLCGLKDKKAIAERWNRRAKFKESARQHQPTAAGRNA